MNAGKRGAGSGMQQDSVAAIIPLFNGARWISSCLESVFAQTHPPSEIIVVDDGSTDNGAQPVEALARQDRRICLLRKANGGQSSARNAGARASRSKLIAFLDQDDLWHPRHVEALIGPFHANPKLGWSFSDADAMDENGTVFQKQLLHIRSLNHDRSSIIECLSRDMCILPSATVISRDAFDAVNGFDERLSGYEDDDLFMRLLTAGYSNQFVDEPLLQWRFHGDRSSYTARMVASRMTFFRKLQTSYPDLSSVYAMRFAMSFLSDLTRNTAPTDRRAIALAGVELALPHIAPAKRVIVRAALHALRASPVAAATLFRVAKPLRRLLQKPQPKLGDGR